MIWTGCHPLALGTPGGGTRFVYTAMTAAAERGPCARRFSAFGLCGQYA